MVCGVLPGDLSSSAPAVGGHRITHHGPRYGIYGRAVGGHIVAGRGRVPVFFTLGQPNALRPSPPWPVSLLGSESFLVYSAGQLATTSAAPIYLNALPYLYEWTRHGNWRSFLKGSVLFTAAAAAHHATLLFGSMFFALPVLALVILDREEGRRVSIPAFIFRTVFIAAIVGAAIAIVLLPFWIALIHYPVTQTPIPHASRANYILSPEWGLNYFVVPYGALILALPFIVLRGSTVGRLRPLLLGFWVAFLVGLGGTTPVGHLLLGRAYEVLTMERFSYWATLLALPFVGLLATELIDRYRMRGAVGLIVAAALSCAVAVAWST